MLTLKLIVLFLILFLLLVSSVIFIPLLFVNLDKHKQVPFLFLQVLHLMTLNKRIFFFKLNDTLLQSFLITLCLYLVLHLGQSYSDYLSFCSTRL